MFGFVDSIPRVVWEHRQIIATTNCKNCRRSRTFSKFQQEKITRYSWMLIGKFGAVGVGNLENWDKNSQTKTFFPKLLKIFLQCLWYQRAITIRCFLILTGVCGCVGHPNTRMSPMCIGWNPLLMLFSSMLLLLHALRWTKMAWFIKRELPSI